MQKLTKNQQLFIESINGNSDKILKKSWLTRGEILTGNALVRKGVIHMNQSCDTYHIN